MCNCTEEIYLGEECNPCESEPVWKNGKKLFSYQEDDVEYLLEVMKKYDGALNFNCRGSGKTMEAIVLAERMKAPLVFIFCPNRLKLKWARDIKDWTGSSSAITISDPYRRYNQWFPKYDHKKDSLKMGNTGRMLASTKWFITNTEQFRNKKTVGLVNSLLDMAPGSLIIIDEAHRLRNQDTKQTQGAQSIKLINGTKMLPMTGTKVVNSTLDVFPLLNLIDGKGFPSESDFMRQYTYGYFMRGAYKPTGNRAGDHLRVQLSLRGVEHSKDEILPDLPPMTRDYIPLEMEKRQREIYQKLEDDLMIELDDGANLWAPNVLAKATRLRQVLCDPLLIGIDAESAKTSALTDVVDPTEQTIIFTAFEQYVALIIQELSYLYPDLKIGRITGKESVVQSDLMQQEFQSKRINVLVGTLKSMNEGLDLFAAEHVVFTDRWWNAATNEQAEDRAHRIGLEHPVRVSIMMVEDSFDEAMEEVIKQKKVWSNELEIREETVDRLREMRAKRGLVAA